MQAGVMVAEQRGDAHNGRRQAVGIEGCIGGKPSHRLSDLMDKLSKSG
jgi:hypothetical protein